MNREKMPLSKRAKIFLPFDAVKGLRQALLAKEYEVEATQKGFLDEEEAKVISANLAALTGKEEVRARYYESGHYLFAEGKGKFLLEENALLVDEKKIPLKDLFGLTILAR